MLSKCLLVASFTAALGWPALAQTPATPAASNTGDAVHLNVVVLPQHNGDPVAELSQGDFTVFDNGQAAPITSFQAVTGPDKAHVMLVIDAVNVPYTQLAYERTQIDHFFRSPAEFLLHGAVCIRTHF